METKRRKTTKQKRRSGARLGQHFLTRPEIAAWVADAVPLDASSTVLEIGPGQRFLTRELLKRAGKVVALEKDPNLVDGLRATFAHELASGTLLLVEGDVRDFDVSFANTILPTSYSLVANIPYYISGYILRKFLTAEHQPANMSLLVQKEVAERIVAKDGKESLLSISVKAYGTPAYVHTVKAGSFSPPPKVDSAVLRISDVSRQRFASKEQERRFFTLLRAGFSSKRKILHGNLAGLVTPETLANCDVAKTARAEELALDDWRCLTQKSGC